MFFMSLCITVLIAVAIYRIKGAYPHAGKTVTLLWIAFALSLFMTLHYSAFWYTLGLLVNILGTIALVAVIIWLVYRFVRK